MSKTEEAAKTFFAKLTAGKVQWDYTDHPAKPLVLAAFDLYARAWGGFDIRRWEWPAHVLKAGLQFDGNQPWST